MNPSANQFGHHFDPQNINPGICSRCGRPPGDPVHDMSSYNDRITEPRLDLYSHQFVNRSGGDRCERCGERADAGVHLYGNSDNTPSPLLVGVT